MNSVNNKSHTADIGVNELSSSSSISSLENFVIFVLRSDWMIWLKMLSPVASISFLFVIAIPWLTIDGYDEIV